MREASKRINGVMGCSEDAIAKRVPLGVIRKVTAVAFALLGIAGLLA